MNLKNYFLKTKKCLETNTIFSGSTDKGDYVKFINHLKCLDNITVEGYYIKYVLNGLDIRCSCGCGIKPKFFKGKFNKYYSDHKNSVVVSKETLIKIKNSKHGLNSLENLLKRTNITVKELEETYFEFINLKKPMSKISDELFIDFRTIKGYWLRLGLIEDKEAFKRFTLKSKSKWLNKVLKPNDNVIKYLKDNVLIIKDYIKNKNKVTFDEINTLLNLKVNKNYLSLFLREHLNSNEVKKIKFIKLSQIEINFLNVLKFYFGDKVNGSFELEGKIFDYKLGKKILIELDGEYWHSKDAAIKNDKIKNKLAKENGYTLVRVSDTEVKNIKFINKIKKLYGKIK